MKKAKRRKGKRMLTLKELHRIQFFQEQGRVINSAKTELRWCRGRKILRRVIIYDNPPHCDCIVRWNDGRYFSFYHKGNILQAKPYSMTLAKYKQLNDKLAK